MPSPFPLRRVLVVEDQAECREMLCELLRLCGHEVEAAGDGLAAVRRALEWRPDAAVIDLGLPLLDGCQVSRALRAGLGGDVFLIALTSFGSEEDRRRTAEAGFDHHLVKPVEPKALEGLLAGLERRNR
jgi:CheY-like chemotaxis protein